MKLYDILEAEKSLVLDQFSNEDAWVLGNVARGVAIEKGLSIAISIEKNNQVVFQYAFEGTSPINDKWIIGKRNVVKATHRSSIYARYSIDIEDEDVNEKLALDNSKDYICVGGSIPIAVKNVGVIGSLTISGLTDELDHEIAMLILSIYINIQ